MYIYIYNSKRYRVLYRLRIRIKCIHTILFALISDELGKKMTQVTKNPWKSKKMT